ncbi:HisA/HisF-related TIM barrel protein [Corynebacterium sp. HS2168-gen11]|uniref:HisA/HisF-related TIM barrel protein n=1 Tax=Corynebacterium sp. HS2168-gen11 TaxID=2974027 RepID=UPI00216AD537|nr:HisA/HisF-related TIM barrel protein [Corynebacterium sp. HS2168-gen11]MCS4536244.1 HisA/HisF-related TIM barrel protein [Corynebacterium sp. HS2168-gen11]
MTFTLLPVVDVSQGHTLDLQRGTADLNQESACAFATASQLQAQGTTWLHIVDHDAAKHRGNNAKLLTKIMQELNVQVELTGGIDNEAAIHNGLALGVHQIVIGAVALENPHWLPGIFQRHADKLAVALAVHQRDGQWRTSSTAVLPDGGDLWEVLERLDAYGCRRFILTEPEHSGGITNDYCDLLRDAAAATEATIVAGSGMTNVADIQQVASYAHEGVRAALLRQNWSNQQVNLVEAFACL